MGSKQDGFVGKVYSYDDGGMYQGETASRKHGKGRNDTSERRQLTASCGVGSGNTVPEIVPGATLPSGTSIRLMAAGGGAPTFDANGQVWGRLELFVGGEWVTVSDYGFGGEEVEVGCRQLGNELGYTSTSWSRVYNTVTPDGSGVQYKVRYCQGNENELSSCREFDEVSSPSHGQDIGLQCTFADDAVECEECPAGKYR